MTLRSRFNTTDNFTCEDVINEQKLLFSDNVCIQNSFLVSQTDIASMSLKVKQGTAKIKGVSVVSDSQETVSIATNTSSYARYDLVILEINSTTFVSSLKVLQGSPASVPSIPDTSSNQLALAKIYVAAGATSILDSNISDIRKTLNYASLCQALMNQDYIVEQGTKGEWTYRKWNSGLAECYCRHFTSTPLATAWRDSWYHSLPVNDLDLPFTFTKIPLVTRSFCPSAAGSDGLILVVQEPDTVSKIGKSMFGRLGNSSTVNGYVNVTVTGKWK